MSRPSVSEARPRAGGPARQRRALHSPSATRRQIAYETLLNSASVFKMGHFSTAC